MAESARASAHSVSQTIGIAKSSRTPYAHTASPTLARVLDHLARQTLVLDVGLAAGVSRDLAAIDGDDVQPDRASSGA
jgi:hypothetical protein